MQQKWSEACGIGSLGTSSAAELENRLYEVWKSLGFEAGTLIHLMYDDNDKDETYHALYLKTIVERAGLRCKGIKGVKKLSFKDGCVVDKDQEPIKIVWKTWSYDTIFSRW